MHIHILEVMMEELQERLHYSKQVWYPRIRIPHGGKDSSSSYHGVISANALKV